MKNEEKEESAVGELGCILGLRTGKQRQRSVRRLLNYVSSDDGGVDGLIGLLEHSARELERAPDRAIGRVLDQGQALSDNDTYRTP